MSDISALRADFPVLGRDCDGSRIVYLDSANTSQKPRQVIDAMTRFLEEHYAPINRSAYRLAAESTEMFEAARSKVARFINSPGTDGVVFTKNATEALNLVARSLGESHLGEGDAVVLTHMEHHANIVPWQQLVAAKGIEIRWIPLTADGRLDLADLDRLVDGAKVVSVTAMSNVLGTINPVARIVESARAAGAISVVDACQSVPHMPTDVVAWGADLVAFSGHKMCGPSGIGVLWGREDVLDRMPPFLGGGNMIADVRLDGFDAAPLPAKFEAGTPPITEAVGLGAAVDYLEAIGMDAVRAHEVELTTATLEALASRFPDTVTVHGPADPAVRGATFSLAVAGVHPHDVSQVFDQRNVCVRAGHHCAKPLMRLLGASATVRASFYLYNNHEDVEALCDAVQDTLDFFGQ